MPSQSTSGHLARCLAWAQAADRLHHALQFAARLDGQQVSAEFFEQFRATPSFGRDLTERLDPFQDELEEWMTQCGWGKGGDQNQPVQLYNLASDIAETKNLAAAMPEKVIVFC